MMTDEFSEVSMCKILLSRKASIKEENTDFVQMDTTSSKNHITKNYNIIWKFFLLKGMLVRESQEQSTFSMYKFSAIIYH